MQYRVSFVAAIYDKSLRLTSVVTVDTDDDVSSAAASSGRKVALVSESSSSRKIVNIAPNDVERLLMACLFRFYLFWSPVQAIAIFGVGWFVIGWSFAAGFGILICIFVPLQIWLSRRFALMWSKISAITDERVRMVSQAVSGVRVMRVGGMTTLVHG